MDGLRFGRQFRALRIRLERRQSDVSARAGVSRSLVAAIDRGELDGVTVGSLVRTCAALGADVDIRLRWRGEQLDRLVDEGHAALVDATVKRLVRLGWTTEVEVSFSIWGERGSIDILAVHTGHRALLVVEVKSVVVDSQATLHGLDRKARLASEIAEKRGWSAGHVSRLLVVTATATSRRRIARLATTYEVALPARGSTVRSWLACPDSPIAGILFLSNDSQDGSMHRSTGRERVRRRKRDLMTMSHAVDTVSPTGGDDQVDTAAVTIK